MGADTKKITDFNIASSLADNLIGSLTVNSPHSGKLDSLKTMLIYKAQSCIIYDCGVSLFDFAISNEKKAELIQEGYKTANQWLAGLQHTKDIEEKEYGSFEELCRDMNVEELEKFVEMLRDYPDTIVEDYYKNDKAKSYFSLALNVYEEKSAKQLYVSREFQDYFFRLIPASPVLLSILAGYSSIGITIGKMLKEDKQKESEKNIDTELDSVNQKEKSRRVINVKNESLQKFIFQEFYIKKMLTLLQSGLTTMNMNLTDDVLNKMLFQAIIPALDINSATDQDALFLRNNSIRCIENSTTSVFWNSVSAIYYKIYSLLCTQEGSKIDIENVFKKINSTYKDIDELIIEIALQLSKLTEQEKAKYFLKKLVTLHPDLEAPLKLIAIELKLEDYKKTNVTEIAKKKSEHPLLTELDNIIKHAMLKNNAALVLEFFNKILNQNREELRVEIKHWSFEKINNLIKSNFTKCYGPEKIKSHPLEEDIELDVDISSFYRVANQISEQLIKEKLVEKISSPKLKLRSSSSFTKSTKPMPLLHTYSFMQAPQDQNTVKSVLFDHFFKSVELTFKELLKDSIQGAKSIDKLMTTLNEIQKNNSSEFGIEVIRGSWNPENISEQLNVIAGYMKGDKERIDEIKNQLYKLITENIHLDSKLEFGQH